MARKHGEFESAQSAILETSMQLFMQKGINGTSLGDIAGAAGMSKGTLYYYYPTKEQLVLDIADIHFAEVADALFAWINRLNRDIPLSQAVESLAEILENERLCRMQIAINSYAAQGNPEISGILRAKHDEWLVMLELGLFKLKPPLPTSLRNMIRFFFLILNGYSLQLYSGSSAPDLNRLLELFVSE